MDNAASVVMRISHWQISGVQPDAKGDQSAKPSFWRLKISFE